MGRFEAPLGNGVSPSWARRGVSSRVRRRDTPLARPLEEGLKRRSGTSPDSLHGPLYRSLQVYQAQGRVFGSGRVSNLCPTRMRRRFVKRPTRTRTRTRMRRRFVKRPTRPRKGRVRATARPTQRRARPKRANPANPRLKGKPESIAAPIFGSSRRSSSTAIRNGALIRPLETAPGDGHSETAS
ncbi:hypothetical protein M885DRAFT_6109 [Pelagophyceae sp. CCMP2097]|nr:hypothetical protein M885DRAFT_6109 [Pelagophyceae sp. CCMP2097]